ncbi:nicotinamidase/pyrazinamidase [Candidatus Symbiopectobacterium sp. 'North America']|uniref:bifunctional nicotinamidase/pyrazinamidase n=1 Tax=Candidatus Symbiopectobacterium sp. 'North America' TaxID=2794574 RepID=UPI0018CB1EE2|nr:bifunctional nicotinamidase/pyrazinamidase [Candidatus Symbiopectobacterium sp. 'North America']MBG6245085.1 nicotinamidase/pyrazinamidase [Candidatus Symbiopectobacterium sp. 'North America']
MNHALLLVYLQNDFCPNGALPVAQGDVTIDVDNVAIAAAQKAGIPVIASQDWHPANHLSFAANNSDAVVGERSELAGLAQTWWPVHCVQGTRGAEFHPRLNREAFDAVIQKGTQHDIDSYSAFFNNGKRAATTLDSLLHQRGITRLTIMGLATDYCVKFTVLDALELGYDVQIVEEGCRGVNLQPDDSEATLADMVVHGARRIGLANFIAVSAHHPV